MIRIANGQGFWGDSLEAPVEQVRRGPLDYLTLDYLAEPLLSGVYGGDPAQLSVGSVLPRFVDIESKYGSLTRGVLAQKAKAPPPAAGRSAAWHRARIGG